MHGVVTGVWVWLLWRGWCCSFVVVVVVVVVVVYLKRLRIVLRCAKAGCGRRTSSS